jgi:hypothetical protein
VAFDPDAYLRENAPPAKAKAKAFDPDAYLAREAPRAATEAEPPEPFDVNKAIAATLSAPIKARALPGYQPRLTAPGTPEHRQASIDSSVASAELAETMDQKATRELNGLLAGSQAAVPFFPRIRGAVAGAGAEIAESVKELAQPGVGETGAFLAAPIPTSAGMLSSAPVRAVPTASAADYNTEFARMQAAYLERKHAQRQIAQAEKAAPVQAAIGSVLTTAALPLGAAKTVGGRIATTSGFGAASGAGAVDRFGVTGEELAAGGAVGAGVGAAAGALGEAVKLGIKGAPQREDKAFVRELTRANGGEGQMAMLAKNKEGLLKDYRNIIEMRKDPAIRKAVGARRGEGIPVIDERLSPLRKAQDARYEKIDASLEHPFNQGTMNAKRLLDELERAKRKASGPDVAAKLSNIQKDITDHWIPNIWRSDAKVIPSREVRRWLTTVQGSAANTPGALNWTNTYASTDEAARAAKTIFNDYLDSAAMPKVADEIRRDNAKITTLLHIRGAMEAKAKKETLSQIGLGQINEEANRKLELGAAGAAMLSGHPEAGAVLLARPYAEKGLASIARGANRHILEPLQLLADRGDRRAKAVISLVTQGIPLASALRLAGPLEKRAAQYAKPSGDPAGKAAQRSALDDLLLSPESASEQGGQR